ncbi:unnamed protein product [Clonostachys rosea]|uniref:C2H2-type domain-containing protein n=1 Tax=Bionectria ochroleuca TaxID=29856 RepID=A0ABY6U3U4_BIOOC|nr:unnamed protein product [Clonostachys rosea]
MCKVTDTNEKPHSCKCGKSFSRRDLLSRHIKVSGDASEHARARPIFGTSTKATNPPEAPVSTASPNNTSGGVPRMQQDSLNRPCPITPACNIQPLQRPLLTQRNENASLVVDVAASEQLLSSVSDSSAFNIDTGGGLDMLWDNLEFSQQPIDHNIFNTSFPFDCLTLDHDRVPNSTNLHQGDAVNRHLQQNDADLDSNDNLNIDYLSNYESRLPSIQPTPKEVLALDEYVSQPPTRRQDLPKPKHSEGYNSWRVTKEDYNKIRQIVDAEHDCMPVGFSLPSRHALSRYIEGFSSFRSHLPFLHFSTRAIKSLPAELILAIASMGAQYRFEPNEALAMCQASKSIIDFKLRLHETSLVNVEKDARWSSVQPEKDASLVTMWSNNSVELPLEAPLTSKLLAFETLQAMVIIITLCTWSHKSLLPISFSMAEKLCNHLRQGWLDADPPVELDWHRWAQHEGRRRTIFTAFIVLNLHTVIYDVPLRLLSSEISSIHLPQCESKWEARTAADWSAAYSNGDPESVQCGQYISKLLSPCPPRDQGRPSTSSFGNLIMIHALLQQIYLVRELAVCSKPGTVGSPYTVLPEDTAARLKIALRQWQCEWALNAESTTRPVASSGPLGFNATGLFRVACVRVNFNLGPFRKLETRDPVAMADAFMKAPLPDRSPELHAAILQSVHSLSIPVRVGINFVSKTHMFTWSIVHIMCNLECALFLSKWAQRISLNEQPVSKEERRLIQIFHDLLLETPFLDDDASMNICEKEVLEDMARVVIQLVAETFRGVHIFELMDPVLRALDLYASYLTKK